MYTLEQSLNDLYQFIKEKLPHREVTLEVLNDNEYPQEKVEKGIICIALAPEKEIELSTGIGSLGIYFIGILKLPEDSPRMQINLEEINLRNEILQALNESVEFRRGRISEVSYSAQLFHPFARVVLTYMGF
jgi:hypothetical protein